MEIPHDFAARQRQTEHFIRGLLEGCLPDDIPRLITSLATATEDNLLKQLVRATDDHALPALTSPSGIGAQPPRSRKRKVGLRLSRGNDNADSGGSSTVAETSRRGHQKVVQADVEHSGSSDEQGSPQGAGGLSTFLPAKPKVSTAAIYNCIFCSTDYTTKGTCKRHLEEIHVAKRYFRCLECSQRFATAPEARKHCKPKIARLPLGRVLMGQRRPNMRRGSRRLQDRDSRRAQAVQFGIRAARNLSDPTRLRKPFTGPVSRHAQGKTEKERT